MFSGSVVNSHGSTLILIIQAHFLSLSLYRLVNYIVIFKKFISFIFFIFCVQVHYFCSIFIVSFHPLVLYLFCYFQVPERDWYETFFLKYMPVCCFWNCPKSNHTGQVLPDLNQIANTEFYPHSPDVLGKFSSLSKLCLHCLYNKACIEPTAPQNDKNPFMNTHICSVFII